MQDQTSRRVIPLTQGQHTVVDAADYDSLARHKWCAMLNATRTAYYAVRVTKRPRQHTILMHREILGIAEHVDHINVDHINGDTLDNRRGNLRPATQAQNTRNRGMSRTNTSGYCGVFWDRNRQLWVARIKLNYRCHYLGGYADPEDAARAYDAAARQLHGEFARLNFPD